MVDGEAGARGRALFDPIIERHLALPDVDMGRMFSTEGLRIRGKVYAFLSHDGELIVKVPRDRGNELVADGSAERMVMRGREMREWITASPDAGDVVWSPLVDEAHDYVDSITPPG